MSNKEQVLSRCKAVVESGGKCPESGVYVYCHESSLDGYFELCYDGGKLCINADGTGEGFEAAAKWLGLDNPWRLTSEELPEEDKPVIGIWDDSFDEWTIPAICAYHKSKHGGYPWYGFVIGGELRHPPTWWKYPDAHPLGAKPE